MRLLNRNKQLIYYRLYRKKDAVTDGAGYETGEDDISYSEAHPLRCSVSPATGNSVAEMFGTLDNYDKVLITEDTDCPIDENSVLVIDHLPRASESAYYDYIVRRVATSLNFKAYAVSFVNVIPDNGSLELVFAVDANGLFAESGGVRARATA